MKRLAVLVGLALFVRFAVFAADANAGFSDSVDRNDPKFVTASLLVISPGNELFSCVGHAAIRLECPTFKHDYCFSYESERAVDRLPAFFAGKLKMGLFAVKTEMMMSEYRQDGRGVRQYQLNLPPDVKQRLWKHLDLLAMKGADLPYDYMQRGCAKSVLDSIKAAFAPQEVKGPLLPITQRETFNRELAETHPWNLFFLNAIVGTETDTFTEVVTPKNLLNYLRAATVDGVPLLTDPGRELMPQTLTFEKRLISPFGAAWLVFALVVLSCILSWTRECTAERSSEGTSPEATRQGASACASPSRQTKRNSLPSDAMGTIASTSLDHAPFVAAVSPSDAMGTIASTWLMRALLVAQGLAGCFFVYLVSAAHLPNSGWNWLLVPFNPVMPAAVIAARRGCAPYRTWGRLVGLGCVLVLVGWVAFMLLAPHAKTDPAYLVLAGAYALVFARKTVAKHVDAMVPIASKSKEISLSDAIGTIASTGEGCLATASKRN